MTRRSLNHQAMVISSGFNPAKNKEAVQATKTSAPGQGYQQWSFSPRVSSGIIGIKKKSNKKMRKGMWPAKWLLVGGLVAMKFIFPCIGNVIIPIDEIIFFRGVAQPPTSDWNIFKNRKGPWRNSHRLCQGMPSRKSLRTRLWRGRGGPRSGLSSLANRWWFCAG